MSAAPVISTHGLAKTYPARRGSQPVEAVRGVDLEVAAGEIVGFLGPNGAGKTTTLRMLTTLLDPTAGEATVNGYDLRRDAVNVRRTIGYVGQAGSSYPEAVVIEEIVDHARLYGIDKQVATASALELFGKLDLDGLERRQVRSLSGGQRRRLDIAMGLVHQPPLVFLDEPTTGLDPQARANLWEHIRSLRTDFGTTVFLTTHYLDEADSLCDRVLVIDNGQIVAEGSPDELKHRVSGDAVVLTLPDPTQAAGAADVAGALPGAGELAVEGAVVRMRVPDGGRVIPTLVRELDARGIVLEEVEVHRPTLDDVFLSLTGRSLRDHADAA
jgi:ABC-2 type transport system ATP-binding protein